MCLTHIVGSGNNTLVIFEHNFCSDTLLYMRYHIALYPFNTLCLMIMKITQPFCWELKLYVTFSYVWEPLVTEYHFVSYNTIVCIGSADESEKKGESSWWDALGDSSSRGECSGECNSLPVSLLQRMESSIQLWGQYCTRSKCPRCHRDIFNPDK